MFVINVKIINSNKMTDYKVNFKTLNGVHEYYAAMLQIEKKHLSTLKKELNINKLLLIKNALIQFIFMLKCFNWAKTDFKLIKKKHLITTKKLLIMESLKK